MDTGNIALFNWWGILQKLLMFKAEQPLQLLSKHQ